MPITKEEAIKGKPAALREAESGEFTITGPHDTKDYGEQFFLMGPDGLVWHQSWAKTSLIKQCDELNRAYVLGVKGASMTKKEGHPDA